MNKALLQVRRRDRRFGVNEAMSGGKEHVEGRRTENGNRGLPRDEFTELVRWLSKKDWERWDKEIEADSEAGRLDFLMREAREEKAKGTLKDL